MLAPKSWKEVAKLLGVSRQSIWRDRIALNLSEKPPIGTALVWVYLIRRWCALGTGGREFSRDRFLEYLLDGTLEHKLKNYGVLNDGGRIPEEG
jgi:hypothetical protein